MPEAQATRRWTPPAGPLGELTAHSAVRARESQLGRAELEAIVSQLEPAPSFVDALRGPTVAVIAELKRQSPSKGVLNGALDAGVRARDYASGGAAALSILTEPTRFGGSLGDLREARAATTLPLLRKDFITDPVQLLEARAFGASAALLIARALPSSTLAMLAVQALAIGLTPLVEVRDELELAEAVGIEGAVIGVNNRNLETLVIDEGIAARLFPLIPRDCVAVYESGVTSVADVARAAAVGADAVLVGSALSTSADGAAMVHSLLQVPQVARG